MMNWVLHLFLATLSVVAQAGSLTKVCHQAVARETPFSQLYNHASAQFANVEARGANAYGYVEALDEVVGKSEFSELLKCRNDIPYTLIFIDPADEDQDMSVSADYDSKGSMVQLQLSLSLKKSFPTALLTYIHELTHVCQKRSSRGLVVEYYRQRAKLTPQERYYYSGRADAHQRGVRSPEYEAIDHALVRENYLGEVEAFLRMYDAYVSFIPQGLSHLCSTLR